jgi:hypothetical protein
MALTRIHEEHEVSSDVAKIFADIRDSFNLPFVPTLFKLSAALPEYLKPMWADLRVVVRSREFHAAARALEELIRSEIIHGGWRMSDQHRVLTGLKFSAEEEDAVGATVGIFAKAIPQMILFGRLMQLGYSGGQRGRISGFKQAGVLARWYTLHVPGERNAGLRAWLIFSDIKRTAGLRSVPTPFRMLAPFPGYLASVWVDTKKLMQQPGFQRACDDLNRRSRAYLRGLPVRDHRRLARGLSNSQWKDIEETVDAFVRGLPMFALSTAVWQRSFETFGRRLSFAA